MMAVTTQPGRDNKYPPIPELPSGLAELQEITEIKIHQHLDSTEGSKIFLLSTYMHINETEIFNNLYNSASTACKKAIIFWSLGKISIKKPCHADGSQLLSFTDICKIKAK